MSIVGATWTAPVVSSLNSGRAPSMRTGAINVAPTGFRPIPAEKLRDTKGRSIMEQQTSTRTQAVLPASTHIGLASLTVADLGRSVRFYSQLLGLHQLGI